MAGSFNRVVLMGNLTQDIELKYTPSETAVANVGIATNRRSKTANGEVREETTFVDCTAWGKVAEIMHQYTKKGDPVLIEGRLTTDQWKDKDTGAPRSKLKVTIESFQFVNSKGGSTEPQQNHSLGSTQAKAPDYGDEIPF